MKRASLTAVGLLFMIAGASTVASAQDDHSHDRDRRPPPPPSHTTPVPPAEQQHRLQEQQQRAAEYRQHLDQQVQASHAQAAQIEMQRRAEQYKLQQQYNVQMQQQRDQVRLRTTRSYANDPYITTAHTYRYSFGGTTRMTNEYGAQVLRSAVNNGYSQGYRAGQADRHDRWASNYQNSIAYRDGNYGYSGEYVDQGDYSYYFRQGFQRGYEDGYNSRYQYGSFSNGSYSVLGNVLTGILGLVSIH